MRLILGVLLATTAIGCGHDKNNNLDGGGGSGGTGGATLKSNIGIDLAHVVGFAISGGGPAAAREAWANADGGISTHTATLYAIDDQGNLVVTHVTTSTGDSSFDLSTVTTSATEKPTHIFDTAKYVYFTFDNLQVGGNSCQVMLRKSDGALFCLPLPDNG